jgi:hypothetical protein
MVNAWETRVAAGICNFTTPELKDEEEYKKSGDPERVTRSGCDEAVGNANYGESESSHCVYMSNDHIEYNDDEA